MLMSIDRLNSEKNEYMKIVFVDFNENILNKTYEWLQDDEICSLIDANPVSLEVQRKWYDELPDKSDYYIKGIMCDSKPIGVVGIKHICDSTGEYWGYIGEKEYWGQGIGKTMVSEMMKDAKDRFNLSILTLRVLETNTRAMGLYKTMGFIEVGIEDGSMLMSIEIL